MTDLATLSDQDLVQLYRQKTQPLEAALEAEGLSGQLADVARSIYAQESDSGKNARTSNAGAVGGMQVMPNTFSEVADPGWNIREPYDNARAGVRYIKKMADLADGDPVLTAAGYYGGPGGLQKARQGIAVSDPRNPNAPNTLEYGRQVAARASKGPIASALDSVTDAILPSANAGEVPELSRMSDADLTAAYQRAKEADRAKPQPTEAAKSPWTLDELGRQVGLTARMGAQAVASVPAMLSDAVTGPINAGLDATVGKGNGFRFQRASDALGNVLTAAGLPQPATSTERVVQDIGTAAGSTLPFVKAGQALAKVASPVVSAVGKQLAQGAGIQAASAATGAGASGITREAGGGPVAQTVAGVAGALAPGFGAAGFKEVGRRMLRGGEEGRKVVEDNLKTFQSAGMQPTLGQATEGRGARAVESLLSRTPGGAGVLQRYAEKQQADMQSAVQRLSDELAPNASAVNAGEAIASGVGAFKAGFKTIQNRLYGTLDQHIAPDTPIAVTRTAQALQDLNAGIPGAPNLSEWFKNSKIKGIDQALQADLEAATKSAAAGAPGTLPYEAIKKLRTLVGSEIADNSLLSDVPRSKWNALYGALSDDLGVAARQAGPEAEQAWSWANTFTRNQIGRLEQLSGIVGKDAPEKIFQAAVSGTAEGDTVVKRIVNAIPKTNRREFAAAVLQRLGRSVPGQQNAEGNAFSSQTFLTNLSKLSPAARYTIFGRTDVPGIAERVQNFANVADNLKAGSKVFANPSGTAQALTQRDALLGTGIAAMTGHVGAAALGVGAGVGANMGARVMTAPGVVKYAARATELAPGAGASAVEAAARLGGAGLPTEAPKVESQPTTPVVPSAPVSRAAAPKVPDVSAPMAVPPLPARGASSRSSVDAGSLGAGGLDGDPAAAANLAADAAAPVAGAGPARVLADAGAQPDAVAPEFASQSRPDGSLLLKGSAKDIRQTLVAAGVPERALMSVRGGLLVAKSQAGTVQAALDRMQGGNGIDVLAHQAAASPRNDLAEPTQAQEAAGNSKMGHLNVQGLDVTVSHPAGATRRTLDDSGTLVESQVLAHAGYIRGTKDADGKQVPAIVGPNGDSSTVFVVNERDGRSITHRALIGFSGADDAMQAYAANHPEQAGVTVAQVPVDRFRLWLRYGPKKADLKTAA